MNYLDQLCAEKIAYAEAIVYESNKALNGRTLYIIATILRGILLLGILILEFHFLHYVFDYIKAEDGEGLSPTLMSFTAGVMVLAFHILALQDKNNIAVRFVNTATKFLLPFYLIGLGLLLAGIIAYGGGLFSLFDGEIVFTPDMLMEEDTNWVEEFITLFNNPIAVLAFSFGIGGLAISNLFCANFLIHSLKEAHEARSANQEKAAKLNASLKSFYAGKEDMREREFDLADLDRFDERSIAEECASTVLLTIQNALTSKKEFEFSRIDFASEPTPYQHPKKPFDAKQLKSRIAAIDALDLEHVMSAMLPSTNSKVS
ncbi:hypothetical protein P886_4180 [Alteromonadaceae bacterium 2753L.S.0a.02]|nr:hypothetical protein P886_4180 [Alteromonadaceae bacterium 2753L.S.0a.02]